MPLKKCLDCKYVMINMFDNSNHAEKRVVMCHEEVYALKSKAFTWQMENLSNQLPL